MAMNSINKKIELPTLDPRARETSFKEHFYIKKCYSKILGMNHIDHFSINVVPSSDAPSHLIHTSYVI